MFNHAAARMRVLRAIQKQVSDHRFVSFTEAGGQITERLNSGDRQSLDPITRDLWSQYDELAQ